MRIVKDLFDIDALIAEAERKPLPWTCTECDEPCKLMLDEPTYKFRSNCCCAVVRQTKDVSANAT